MKKEEIELLAIERYPIGDVSDNDRNTLEMFRRIYIEGATKVASMMFTKDDVDTSFYKGFNNGEVGKFLDILRMEMFFQNDVPREYQAMFERKFNMAVDYYTKSIK